MQAFESACLSLTEFRQRSGFADSCESRKRRRRDETDALKTVFWAFSLQTRTGLETAYAMERLFEPSAFRRTASGERFHHNKWSGYVAGLHRPVKVLAAVEALYPGANACLAIPLWAAMTARALTRKQLEALVLPLEPGIQALLRRRGTAPRPPRFPHASIDRDLARALERRRSLDALAAAVIMVRIAHVEGETAAAFEWGRRLIRIALVHADLLYAGGITGALLELLEERVLTLAWHDGARPTFHIGRLEWLNEAYVQFVGGHMPTEA